MKLLLNPNHDQLNNHLRRQPCKLPAATTLTPTSQKFPGRHCLRLQAVQTRAPTKKRGIPLVESTLAPTTTAAPLGETPPELHRRRENRESARRDTEASDSKTKDKNLMLNRCGDRWGGGDKPPWLSLRRALPYIQRGERPPSLQPRVRPEHEPMLQALRNAQNYYRDADGKVVRTGPTTTSSSSTPSSSPTRVHQRPQEPQPGPTNPGTKADTAAAADHKKRQAENPYLLPPHLRPRDTATSAAATDRPTVGSAHGHNDGDGGTPRKQAKVRFSLPDDHRESPPKPTRYRTALRKLTNSTSIQLRIDGVMHNPTIIVENRPAYMIPEADANSAAANLGGERSDPRLSQRQRDDNMEDRTTWAQATTMEHGEPLFFQPPALRYPTNKDDGSGASSSTEPLQPLEDTATAHSSAPSDVLDLENEAELAAQRGDAPVWLVTDTDSSHQMQATVRVGVNTQDVSWIWGAMPSTLPPAFPLDQRSILSMRGTADGSWRGVVWRPSRGQTIFHPRRHRHEPTLVIFNTFGSYQDNVGTLPVGVRLTLTPVGEWMGITKIGLGIARTPKFWLVNVDEVESSANLQGSIPLEAGDSFWLAWSSDGVWARRTRFQGDISQLGGIATFPQFSSPRPPTPPERRDGPTRLTPSPSTRTSPQQPAHHRLPQQQQPPPPLQPARDPPGQRHATLTDREVTHRRPGQEQGPRDRHDPLQRAAPSPGSESETSWPSEDENYHDQDDSVLMQTGGRASSSTDPPPSPPGEIPTACWTTSKAYFMHYYNNPSSSPEKM